MEERLSAEIASFKRLWQGGYFEGDPLDPLARSGYGQLGFMSILHATYLRCIKPYVNLETIALEIGPGRGAWTKALLSAREVWCLDVLSAEHNRFYDYLGHPLNVRYFQVYDFNCSVIPENYFTYMFSFGCLCHVSFEGIRKYAKNIFPKLRQGSDCFWMVADYRKYSAAMKNLDRLSIYQRILPPKRLYSPMRWLLRLVAHSKADSRPLKDEDDVPRPGRWYDAGIERTCAMLESVGYQVIDPDVGVNHRDPVIYFIKP
jgi:hypothetical protein